MTRLCVVLLCSSVLFHVAGCVERPLASRAARELAGQARYPPGAYPIASTFADTQDVRGLRRRTAHSGIDIRAPAGTAVVAAASGRVRVVQDPGAGTVILLETSDTRNPMQIEFAHLEQVLVEDGATVTRGQRIATVGRSGRDSGGVAHLHFAVAPDGGEVTDPAPLIMGSGGVLCAGKPERGRAGLPELLYPVACDAE